MGSIFCGLAVSFRIQLAPAVAFAVLYICRSNWRARTPAVAAGLLLPIVGFGLVDWFTWSYPFQSFTRNFWVNVIEQRSLVYGTEPWYWYEVVLAKHFGPMLLFALLGVRRSPFLGWLALIILLSHSVIGHKEARFLYPLTPMVITLAALGIVEVAEAARTFGQTATLARSRRRCGVDHLRAKFGFPRIGCGFPRLLVESLRKPSRHGPTQPRPERMRRRHVSFSLVRERRLCTLASACSDRAHDGNFRMEGNQQLQFRLVG